jgi:kinesin family member 17
MVRARPMNKRELAQKTSMCVEIDKSINGIIVTPPGASKETTRQFTYDVVYGEDSTQRQVYDEGAFSLVESVMNGYNGTIFAYGQTGCGKTHTMIGVKGDKSQNGIIPNAFDHIFGYFDDAVNFKKKFLIRCSYLEIYNESIRDLLSKDVEAKLDLKETPDTGVYVKGLTTCIVKSIPEIEAYMDHGTKNRMTGETAMNKDSSRSHSIFTIYVETSEADEEGDQRIKAGKLNLVDLAGSERQSKT